MAWLDNVVDSVVQDYTTKKLNSSFLQANVLLYLLGLSQENSRPLGQPSTGAIFGGANLTKAQVQSRMGGSIHKFQYQRSQRNDGAVMTKETGTPTASARTDENIGTAGTRWTFISEPAEISEFAIDATEGSDLALTNLIETAAQETLQTLLKRVNTMCWTGTLTQAQQQVDDEFTWPDVLGIQHTSTANNWYGGVNRAVETSLNPSNYVATTTFGTSVPSLEWMDILNVGGDATTGGVNVGVGRSFRDDEGIGINVCLCPPTIWHTLRREAEGTYAIYMNGIPNHPIGGAKYPVIEYGKGRYFVADPDCPTGTVFFQPMHKWILEVNPKYNFRWKPWVKKADTEQGAKRVRWSNLEAQIRLTCTHPWLPVMVTGCTAA